MSDSEQKQSSYDNVAFTSALYNSFAIVFLIIGIGLSGLLLVVLSNFVRSIIWALLTGAFLFTFKFYLTKVTFENLKSIDANGTSLIIHLCVLPFRFIDSISDYTWSFSKTNMRNICILFLGLISVKFLSLFYELLFAYALIVYIWTFKLIELFTYYADKLSLITCTLLVGYWIMLIFYWQDEYKSFLRFLSIPAWFNAFVLVSQILGSYRIYFIVISIILISLGIFSYIKEIIIQYKDNIDEASSRSPSTGSESDIADGEKPMTARKSSVTLFDSSFSQYEYYLKYLSGDPTSMLNSDIAKTKTSNKYFILLFWLFISIRILSNSSTIFLLTLFLFGWKLFKIFLIYLFLETYDKYLTKINKWFLDRNDVFKPKLVDILVKLFLKGDYKLNELLQKSLDSITSLFLIFILLFSALFTIILLAMQVHTESIELISIVKNIINDNIYSQPFLSQVLPEKAYLNDIVQTEINRFYVYGRDIISSRLKNYIESKDQQVIIEQQILTQWDYLYSYLSQTNSTSISNNNNVTLGNSATLTSMFNNKNLFDIIKSNLGILLSVVDSIYNILKSNLNILYTVLQVTLSLLFQSGSAVFKFIIQMIVYLTVLFYLLSTSKNVYKPLKWLNEMTIFKNKDILSRTIEDSISSVFVATFKMAFFYGLYTFLIHDAFSLNIAYIPSIVASIFACLPIINTYWVGLPGFLTLWLIDGKPIFAFAFFFALVLPTYFVDMAIYSEIKVSHPYLTGLAIAGGLFCFGLEGAVIGPIVLCLFIVIIRFNQKFLSS